MVVTVMVVLAVVVVVVVVGIKASKAPFLYENRDISHHAL